MFIHFPYSKQLKLGVCDGFSGHLCFQTHPTSATAMDSTSSQVLMPHRSDGLVGYHSYSLFRAYGDWALGPSTSSECCFYPVDSYMVLYGFIMFYHVSFVLQFWWSNTLLIGTIQMSGHQIRSNLTAWW
jgi:hypothetical protein